MVVTKYFNGKIKWRETFNVLFAGFFVSMYYIWMEMVNWNFVLVQKTKKMKGFSTLTWYKYGIQAHQTVEQAKKLDKANINKLYQDYIDK